jgi:hypothetical protein
MNDQFQSVTINNDQFDARFMSISAFRPVFLHELAALCRIMVVTLTGKTALSAASSTQVKLAPANYCGRGDSSTDPERSAPQKQTPPRGGVCPSRQVPDQNVLTLIPRNTVMPA